MNQDAPLLLWRLRVVMAERDVRTTRALRKRLLEQGIDLSEAQLGRIVKALPASLNTALLAALCQVLNTTPAELLVLHGRRSQSIDAANAATGASPQAPAPEHTEPLTLPPRNPSERPRATAFPMPKLT